MQRSIGRREFLRTSTLAAIAATIGIPSLTGCAVNVKALLTTLITSIQAILKVATGATWATDLTSALAQLSTAVASWTAGGAVTIVTQALNAVEAVLAVIPLTAVYSPLVDVVVAGIEAVLNALSPAPTLAPSFARATADPHRGRVVLHRGPFETWQGAYKKTFNTEAKLIGLPQAEI